MRREPAVILIALALSLWLAGGCGRSSSGNALSAEQYRAFIATGMTSDLRAEVTVPHLWATIVTMAPKDGKMGVRVHLERGGGLGPLKVSVSDMLRVVNDVALRTQDGDAVGAKSHDRWGSPTPRPAAAEDYVSIPDEGLELPLGPVGEAAGPLRKSLASKPSDLATGTPLRYYLCAEVNGRSEDLTKSFYVPVLGVGLVQFSGKAE